MDEGAENRAKIRNIRAGLQRGELDYDQAKKMAQPIIDRMNKRGAEISKEHGMKFKKITFNSLMR